jgi:hypothetical protein
MTDSMLVFARPAPKGSRGGSALRPSGGSSGGTFSIQPMTRGLPWSQEKIKRVLGATPAVGDMQQAKTSGRSAAAGWQQEVLSLAPLVGEVGFVIGRISGSARRCVVAPRVTGEGPNAFPRPVTDEDELPAGSAPAELVRRFVRLSAMLGECILVCPPPPSGFAGTQAEWRGLVTSWEAHSPLAVKVENVGQGGDTRVTVTGRRAYGLNEAVALRTFVSADEDADAPYSALRNCLGPMREIIGLSMHVAATIDSRLASAGILFVSNMAEVTPPGQTGSEADEPAAYLAGGQGVAQALTDVAMISIQDRDSASAVAPIVVAQPDEAKAAVHLQFGTQLDEHVVPLRDQSIRRLAMGMDVDPSILLGTADASHFSSFSIATDFFLLTTAPFLDDFALAIGVATGRPFAWDAARVLARPNKFVEVQAAYDRGAASDEALRRSANLAPKDAPAPKDPALAMALRLVDESPSLMQNPGLPDVVAQCRAALNGTPYEPQPRPGSADQGRETPPPAGESEVPARSDGSPSSGAEGLPHEIPA